MGSGSSSVLHLHQNGDDDTRTMGSKPIRLMLADDHQILTGAIAARLEAEPDFTVVATTGSAVAAASMAASIRPDVLMLDVRFPDGDGIEVARHLREVAPEIHIVFVTAFDDTPTASAAVLAGAAGFVVKGATTDELMAALRAVVRDEAWIQPRVLRRVLDDLARGPARLTADQEKLARLTQRERAVFDCLLRGVDRSGIARELYLSTNTVRTHVRNLLAKLEVHSSLEAVALGLRVEGRSSPGETGPA